MAHRLSSNRAARKAAVSTSSIEHFSNIYHLNRRIEVSSASVSPSTHSMKMPAYDTVIPSYPIEVAVIPWGWKRTPSLIPRIPAVSKQKYPPLLTHCTSNQAGYSLTERRKDPYDPTLFPAYQKRGSNLYKSSMHASMLAWAPEWVAVSPL